MNNKFNNCLLCLRNLFNHSLIYLSSDLKNQFSLSLFYLLKLSQSNVQQNSQVIQKTISVNIFITTASTEAEKHTRFLSMIIDKNKIFQIFCFIKKTDETEIRSVVELELS